MKYFLIIIFTLLVGCEDKISETKGPIQGVEVEVRADAYEEMCAREPQSPLCVNEQLQ